LWKKSYPECGGDAQSPVDLPKNLSLGHFDADQALHVSYVPLEDRRLVNTGHNLQVNGPFGSLVLSNETYSALLFNFHFPSEHTVDGHISAGEMHIVHQKLGASGTADLAIVSILLEIVEDGHSISSSPQMLFFKQLDFNIRDARDIRGGKADEEEREEEEEAEKAEKEAEEKKEPLDKSPENGTVLEVNASQSSLLVKTRLLTSEPAPAPMPAPAAAMSPAPARTRPTFMLPVAGNSNAIGGVVDIGKAFSHELKAGYYHYEGSLTTPPCSESVRWYVLSRKAPITLAVVESFKALFPSPSNSRPLQDLNDRRIVWATDSVRAPPQADDSRGERSGVRAHGHGWWLMLSACLLLQHIGRHI
jgi:carbonic anhydrase